jgi:hypothetical protein
MGRKKRQGYFFAWRAIFMLRLAQNCGMVGCSRIKGKQMPVHFKDGTLRGDLPWNLKDARNIIAIDGDIDLCGYSYPMPRLETIHGISVKDAPVIPSLHSKIYEAASKPGALNMRHWHDPHCKTTHCRAGWTVAVAGRAGKSLEEMVKDQNTRRAFTPTPARIAACLIYIRNDPNIFNGGFPNFYCSNEKALADMRLRARNERTKSK